MDKETVTISQELLDMMVNALSRLPYLDVHGVFGQLAHELADDEPKIQLN